MSFSLQLFHRFGNQSLMLTVRTIKPSPNVRIIKKGADFTVHAAVDVYVVCNSSETSPHPGMTVDSVCNDTMPLALTLGIVRLYTFVDSGYSTIT